MAFGISKGFGFEKTLEKFLLEKLEGQQQVAVQVVEFSRALLENVKGGWVAGIGLLILFYTVLKILSHIESAFNDIWDIKQARGWGRKISDYLSLMLICPVFFIVSSTLSVMITSSARLVMQRIWLLEAVSPAIYLSLKLLPFCLLWILFIFLYHFIPNTHVKWTAALTAGIIAGTIYTLFQRFYIGFQVGVSKYNAIYGSFAALPLFFIWLQLSWVIVLLGAEIAFAYQNVGTARFEKEVRTVSHAFKRLLSLRVVHFLVNNFSGPKVAWQDVEIARRLEIPIRLVHEILNALVESGIVSPVVLDPDQSIGYQPGKDPDLLTVKYVITALETRGNDVIPVPDSQAMRELSDSLLAFDRLIETSPANQRLKDISSALPDSD